MTALQAEDFPHYYYEDYAQWEGQWELIEGIPFAMTPAPVLDHQRVCKKIIRQLDELLENCNQCEAFLPVDWQITADTVVQPDILVVCGDKLDGVKLEKIPVLIFEVLSTSTSRKDKIVKYRLYENAGVKYYCIVDPKNKSAEVYELQPDAFREAENFAAGKMLFHLGPCRIRFDFNDIFS